MLFMRNISGLPMNEDKPVSYPRLPLARFDKLINLTIARLLREIDCPITRRQEIILRELKEVERIGQGELADRVGQDRNNLSRTLTLLEKNNLIARHTREDDKRHFDVRITPLGRIVHDQAYKAIESYRKILFDGMSVSEIDAFARFIERLSSNLASFVRRRWCRCWIERATGGRHLYTR